MTIVNPAGPHVVAVGGGHGLAMTLRAVIQYAGRVTAVVSTADDGGSSGRLRRQIDMPAPGDLRRCITALAPDHHLAAAVEHRFSTGELNGHPIGNLVLAGLVDAGNDLVYAAHALSQWLGLDESVMVLPATTQSVELVALTPDGPVRGQVDVEQKTVINGVELDPPDPDVPKQVLRDIHIADQIVLGPGSLYASVIAAAGPAAIRDALAARTGNLVWVANLRAEEPGVQGLDIGDHLAALAEHGITPDVVVVQEDALPLGSVPDSIEVVTADVDRPHGLAHDSDLLAPVLARLA